MMCLHWGITIWRHYWSIIDKTLCWHFWDFWRGEKMQSLLSVWFFGLSCIPGGFDWCQRGRKPQWGLFWGKSLLRKLCCSGWEGLAQYSLLRSVTSHHGEVNNARDIGICFNLLRIYMCPWLLFVCYFPLNFWNIYWALEIKINIYLYQGCVISSITTKSELYLW